MLTSYIGAFQSPLHMLSLSVADNGGSLGIKMTERPVGLWGEELRYGEKNKDKRSYQLQFLSMQEDCIKQKKKKKKKNGADYHAPSRILSSCSPPTMNLYSSNAEIPARKYTLLGFPNLANCFQSAFPVPFNSRSSSSPWMSLRVANHHLSLCSLQKKVNKVWALEHLTWSEIFWWCGRKWVSENEWLWKRGTFK